MKALLMSLSLVLAIPTPGLAEACTPLGGLAEICSDAAGWTALESGGGDPRFGHSEGETRVIMLPFPDAAESGAALALQNIYLDEISDWDGKSDQPAAADLFPVTKTFSINALPSGEHQNGAAIAVSVVADSEMVALVESVFPNATSGQQLGADRLALHSALVKEIRRLP